MSKFTPFPEPQGCKELTVGEIYGPAMKITDPEDAQNYFNNIVHYMFFIDPTRTEEEHFQIQKSNLGYYAGYYDMETAARVQRLFQCVHPIFGNLNPTAEEAFELGKRWAKGEIKTKEQPVSKLYKRTKRTLIID
jgi:hypothetical protein